MESELRIEERQSEILYLAPEEGKDSPELLLFNEELLKDSGWKRASEKGRQLWERIKERYEQMACEVFAGDRFVRRLRRFKRITILLNKPIEPAIVKARLKQMLRDRSYHHLRWLIVDALLLPLSIFIMPLPGPNILGYYLLFRIYSHWKAFRSASRTTLEDVDIQVSTHAHEVNAFIRKCKDVRTGLKELRKKYRLRALQEQEFISQSTAIKEALSRFKLHFEK